MPTPEPGLDELAEVTADLARMKRKREAEKLTDRALDALESMRRKLVRAGVPWAGARRYDYRDLARYLNLHPQTVYRHRMGHPIHPMVREKYDRLIQEAAK